MEKREKKPKVVRLHLYNNDLEAELKSIREEAKTKEEIHRNWDIGNYKVLLRVFLENYWE